jgi:hydrogenase maturation protease
LALADVTGMIGSMRLKRILVLGLGNDILSDDSVGLIIARRLRSSLSDLPAVKVQETCEMGLSLLDFIDGYHGLVLVDAVQTRHSPPGYLHEIELSDLKVLPLMSPHFLGIGEILKVGSQLEMSMPTAVKIFAIEVQDPFTVSTELTAALAAAVEPVTQRIATVVREMRQSLV